MKILDVPRKFPFPLKDGEAISVTYLSKALHEQGAELVMLSVNQIKQPFDITTLPASYNHFREYHLIDIDNRVKPLDAFLNLFTKKSYHIERFVSKAFEKKLIELLEKEDFDIVQLESVNLSPYTDIVRKHSKAKVVMRSHKVEHEIWERITRNTSAGPKKWYLRLLSRRLRNYELSHINDYDALLTVTQRDLDIFKSHGCHIPSLAVTVGLDLSQYTPQPIQESKVSFGFIGTLDWMPNTEGLQWLLENVWPEVIALRPDAEFHIAGKNAPDWLLEGSWKGVHFHGQVPDAQAFMFAHPIQLVPLLSGSGIRVKIIEAMALGRVVVSTTLGIEGIDALDGVHACLTDTVSAFVERMVWCIDHPEALPEIGANASALMREHFDNRRTGKKLYDFYTQLLGKR